MASKPVSRAMTDFSDPGQRLDYLVHHGVDAYNKAMEDHFAKVVETVNGHAIRLVHTMRFGALYMIDGLNNVMIYGNYGPALFDGGLLVVLSIVVFALAVRFFRWRED